MAAFEITSPSVDFGMSCPGVLMQRLQVRDLPNVRKITKLRTGYSAHEVTYMCSLGTEDLASVGSFIRDIDALEDLTVLTFESDVEPLWPAVLKHAGSLASLALHGPPQRSAYVWTAGLVGQVGEKMKKLQRLEMDVGLWEAESYLKGGEPKEDSALGELVKLAHVETVVVNVNLQDEASAFAGTHTWNAMGSISFPEADGEACEKLARRIFEAFQKASPDSGLKHLEVRFPRRCWDDRCQFWTMAYSVHVKKEGGEVKVERDGKWNLYLPGAVEYEHPEIMQLVREARDRERARRGW